jgi:hypothetical protein
MKKHVYKMICLENLVERTMEVNGLFRGSP